MRLMKPEARWQGHIFEVRTNHEELKIGHGQENLVAYWFSGSIGAFAGLRDVQRFTFQNDPFLIGIHTRDAPRESDAKYSKANPGPAGACPEVVYGEAL